MTIESRRTFLLAGLAAIPLFKAEACASEGESAACRETEESQYGPFYREGAPWRTRLCDASEAGDALVIAGRVASAARCAPLEGATLDVWQANAAGFYDSNDPARPDPALYRLRGRIKTDAAGRYQFETILPANYGQGSFMRAKHIHMLVTCPGHEPLVTEIYFEGDERNATDRLVRRALITPLSSSVDERSRRKRLSGTFDITLAKAR